MNRISRNLAVVYGVGLCLALFEVVTLSECDGASWTSVSGLLECASLGASRMPALHKDVCIMLSCGLFVIALARSFFGDETDASNQVTQRSQGKESDDGVGP